MVETVAVNEGLDALGQLIPLTAELRELEYGGTPIALLPRAEYLRGYEQWESHFI